MNEQEFLEKARSIHGYKYNYPDLPEKIISNTKIKVEFQGVIYTQKVVKHILLKRCPEKITPKKTTDQFIRESKKLWGNKYDYSLVEYKSALQKVKIIYDGVVFDQVASSHLMGLAPEKNLNLDNFIRKSRKIHGNKYDYSKVEFISGDIPVHIGYGGIFYLQKPYHHLQGRSPENLHLSIKKTQEKFIEESNEIHDNKYSYSDTIYVNSQSKVIISCPTHGNFSQRALAHIKGSGCPSCRESRGEKEVVKFLEKNRILYQRQFKFVDCFFIRPLNFDFYIPSMRICIEFDGEQHYYPSKFFGGEDKFELGKKRDDIKNKYCEENYINLIRIKYDQIESIQEILWENLKTFIKLKMTR